MHDPMASDGGVAVSSASASDPTTEWRLPAPGELVELYRRLLVPRLIEEKMLRLLRQGRLSKWFSGIGQEAIAVGVSAAHLMGGCGMGSHQADSVTDGWGRVHGLPWLRVADASLFPNSVEMNPYLTVMALADRAAEAVRSDLGSLT